MKRLIQIKDNKVVAITHVKDSFTIPFTFIGDMRLLLVADPNIDIKLDYVYNLETNTFSEGV